MIEMPAACPAEVRLLAEMPTAAATESPARTAMIPNPKETERYPSAIGMPWMSPFLKSKFIFAAILHV